MRALIVVVAGAAALSAQTFTDVAAAIGLSGSTHMIGHAWGDLDGDCDWDVFTPSYSTVADQLFRNDGGTFTDISVSAGINVGPFSHVGVSWGDFDQNATMDAYVVGWGTSNWLWSNNGNQTFTDVTAMAGVGNSGSALVGCWLDYDRDGDLDLSVCNAGSNSILYRNNGNGTFTDVAAAAGVSSPGSVWPSANLTDYDRDGWLDIYYASGAPSMLYHNNGDGTFTDVAAAMGVTNPGRSAYSVAWGDYDLDGDFDLYVANNGGGNRLYRNDGASFTDVTAVSGTGVAGFTEDAGWGDYDNDGDPDLYVTVSSGVCYRNNGDGTFTDVAAAVGLQNPGAIEAAQWVDFDGDGDLDLFNTSEFGNNFAMQNSGTPGMQWLQVRLVGDTSFIQPVPVDAYGSVAEVFWSGGRLPQMMDGGGGWGRQRPPVMHWGLGAAAAIDSLTVDWTDGTSVTIPGALLPVDSLHVIYYPGTLSGLCPDPVGVGIEFSGEGGLAASLSQRGGALLLSYSLPAALDARFTLYRADGALERSLSLGSLQGDGVRTLGLPSASGVYLWRFVAGGAAFGGKTAVVR